MKLDNIETIKTNFYKMLLVTIVLLTSCEVSKPKQVLFIGNSLTYYHDMPQMLQEMLTERNIKINIEQATLPGASLADHLNNEQTLMKIKSKTWDFLVLQEGTVRVLIPEARKYKFENSVAKIDSMAKEMNSKILLYQNYAISIYPEQYCYPSILISDQLPDDVYCSDSLYNSNQEFIIIENSFSNLSQKIDSDVAQVGKYFEACKKKFPELILFESSSDTHPSKLGSYLIALVFFKKLTNLSVSLNMYTAGLPVLEVEKINEIVDSI